MVRNYLTGRLDLHEFGKELPYRKAGSRQNCRKLHKFSKELPYRKAGSGNCTKLVRNYLTGRLDLYEFGKELPYRKAGSMQNCSKLHEFGMELPYRKVGSAQIW